MFVLFFTELFVDDCVFSLLSVDDDSGDFVELATGEPLAVEIGV
jgi:hypothetical protein